MSHEEIAHLYRNAKRPERELGILAQLNGVKKKDILAIIEEHDRRYKDRDSEYKILLSKCKKRWMKSG